MVFGKSIFGGIGIFRGFEIELLFLLFKIFLKSKVVAQN
jgi:hypothetical protein